MRWLNCAILALLLALSAVHPAWARGGGGCVAADTLISTPSGPVRAADLHAGSAVYAAVAGRLVPATVLARMVAAPEPLRELVAGEAVLRVTAAHLVQTAPGVFRPAGSLRVGDAVCVAVAGSGGVTTAPLVRVTTLPAPAQPLVDLLVSPGDTYVAGGLVLHNKGCFLPATPVQRADGTAVAIAQVQPGDTLLAFTPAGAVVHTTVLAGYHVVADSYYELSTAQTRVQVTAEHPFYVGHDTYCTVAALHVGDAIFAYDGAGLRAQTITALRQVPGPVTVYNLQVDEPHTFFAAGLAVHNKGGGGGGHSSGFHSSGGSHSYGSSGGGGSIDIGCGGALAIVVVIVMLWLGLCGEAGDHTSSGELDYSFSRAAIAGKAGKTDKLLTFIARTDPAFAPAALTAVARDTFLKLQECWQLRQYEPMQPLLVPYLYQQHQAQLAALRRQHEINQLDDLEIQQIDLVNVRYTEKAAQREFTALFSVSARDHYLDDRSGEHLRGDDDPAPFQEFWTFQLMDGTWRLREIEQSRESHCLQEENFFAPFTDLGKEQVYGDTAAQSGPAGPAADAAVLSQTTKIERLLNFLVQTDKLWQRQAMLERAREVYVATLTAQEAGELGDAGAYFPAVAADLRAFIVRNQADGHSVEYRNLCVRKVELVLVRNYDDNTRDEYTVRISAHAQQILRTRGSVTQQDADVVPFVDYWTFGRLDGAWRLKEVLPPAAGEAAATADNVDEGSSPAQLQWYYSQTRAV